MIQNKPKISEITRNTLQWISINLFDNKRGLSVDSLDAIFDKMPEMYSINSDLI